MHEGKLIKVEKLNINNTPKMQVLIVLTLALVVAWVVYSKWSDSRRPPGPPRLPIFGNIFQLGRNPHKSLAQLAKTYGPLMSIQLGTGFNIVISSPDMAREVLSKQILVFSNPINHDALYVHDHGRFSIGLSPMTSDRWKKIRRIAKERLFSNQALQATKSLRQERLRKLADHVSICSGEGRAMNIGEATFTAMFNLVFTTLFSVEFIDHSGPTNNELKEHVDGFTRIMGLPNISDFFPILAPFDLQGLRRKLGHHLGSVLDIIENLVEKRLQERKASSTYEKKNDFLETLLDLMEGNENDLSIDEIKHLFVDLTIGGSDTSAAATEWTMTELLLHPNKLVKLKAELKSVIGEKKIIEETDIAKLPYLQATVKEGLRYHPITPLLVPHVSQHETQINGYKIPKNTKAFVNYWAITRDPSIWKNPECFEPERFLDNNIDSGGQNFELIPFGSGRRTCPGMPLANRVIHCMVATLCHNFDWKFEEGAESEQLQREDVFGTILQKKIPLRAIPVKV